MFFNAIKATCLISAVGLAVDAATTQHESTYPPVSRRCVTPSGSYGSRDSDGYGSNPCQGADYSVQTKHTVQNSHASTARQGADYSFQTKSTVKAGYGSKNVQGSGNSVQTTQAVVATGGIDVMAQGWASITPACQQLEATFSSRAQIDVALQAAYSLRDQVQSVSNQYASCGCSASSQTSAAFQQIFVQFVLSMGRVLQVGQQVYADAWQPRFTAIFRDCSPAFVRLQAIAVFLQVDLRAALQTAGVDLQLFANVGLNVAALLRLNLSVGGFVNPLGFI